MRKSSLHDDVAPDEKYGQVKVILHSTPAFQERATTSGCLDKNRVDRCRHALSPATCRAQESTSPPCVFSGRSKVVSIWLPTKGWVVDQSSPTGCRRPRTGATVESFRVGWLRRSFNLCISSCFRNSARSIQITSSCRGASNCKRQRWSPLASTSRSTTRPFTQSLQR